MHDFDKEIERDEEGDFEDPEFETPEDEDETLEELDIDDNGHLRLGRKRRKRHEDEEPEYREFDDE